MDQQLLEMSAGDVHNAASLLEAKPVSQNKKMDFLQCLRTEVPEAE